MGNTRAGGKHHEQQGEHLYRAGSWFDVHQIFPEFIIFLALLASTAASADSIQPPPTGKLIDVGGYQVHLFCEGTGSPTVMIVGGFSFDWALVQPKIAGSTRVCTYDPSGTAWSDPFPTDPTPNCAERIEELHRLLTNAPVDGPYVVVGFSIGGLYARLYADRYPKDVVGMVLVDHAFIEPGGDHPDKGLPSRASQSHSSRGAISVEQADTPPVLISETPIVLGIEDDRNFRKLPEVDQDLHAWAMAAHPVRPTGETAAECFEAVASATASAAKNHSEPLGNIPLIVISTRNSSSGYKDLQTTLLGLSRDSRQIVAENSTHMVIVDEPEVIVRAIEQVVRAVRKH